MYEVRKCASTSGSFQLSTISPGTKLIRALSCSIRLLPPCWFFGTSSAALSVAGAHKAFTDSTVPCGCLVIQIRSFAGKNEMLSSENARFWNENLDATET